VHFRITLLRAIIVVLVYIVWSDTSLTKASTPPPKEGDMVKFVELAPPLPVPEASFYTSNGKKINLNMFKGAWLLVNFWATWCAPCISELPSLYNLKQNKSSSKFKILLVSIDRAGPKVYKPFLKKLGLSQLKSASDPKANLMRALKISGIPTTLLIDPKSYIVGMYTGDAKWDHPFAETLLMHYVDRLREKSN
jgi:thiol-disulfide isomerase/thioredoxin